MDALVTYARMVQEARMDGQRGLLIAALHNLYREADEILVELELERPTMAEASKLYIDEVGADLTKEDEL